METQLESGLFKVNSEMAKPKSNEDAEEIHPVDLTPQEIVISIDHIMDSIFSLVDTSDLFACRLVSRRFLKCAQRSLEKRIHKSFHFPGKHSHNASDSSGRTLEQLTNFLEQSASASEANHQPISIPCTHFWFNGFQLGDSTLQNFLNIFGSNVRSLGIVFRIRHTTHENLLMDQLCNLLTVQAPHLEILHLSVDLMVAWQPKIPTQLHDSINEHSYARRHYSPLLNSNLDFQEIFSRLESFPRKSSLKILKIYGSGLANTIEYLLQLSPKLQEVGMANRYYPHLLQPVKRVHLLKKLHLFDSELQPEDYSHEDIYWNCITGIMETISLENDLRLRRLSICFEDILCACKNNFEWEKRVVLVTNRLLECSRDTLECLILSLVTFLPGIKMPSPMPKVYKIEIDVVDRRDKDSTVFPIGFCLAETFPKLLSVEMRYYQNINNDILSYEFLNCLDFGENWGDVLSFGVKKFVLDVSGPPSWLFTTIPPFISRKIKKLFPNAEIEF